MRKNRQKVETDKERDRYRQKDSDKDRSLEQDYFNSYCLYTVNEKLYSSYMTGLDETYNIFAHRTINRKELQVGIKVVRGALKKCRIRLV